MCESGWECEGRDEGRFLAVVFVNIRWIEKKMKKKKYVQ